MTALETTADTTAAGAPAPVRRRDAWVLLAAAASLQASAWALLLWGFAAGWMGYGLHQLSDTLVYQFYAHRFATGDWPYADVPVEYPPLADLVFLLAPSAGTVAQYERWFAAVMIAATMAAAVLATAAALRLYASVTRALATAAVYAALTLCCGALAANRYDAVVALVVAATMVLLAHRSWTAAGVALGAGFALKLTPILLLPLTLILASDGRRRWLALGGFALAAALPFVPFALHDPTTVAYPFAYHGERPLQLESVLATPWAVDALLGGRPPVVSSHGSQGFAGPGPDAVAALSPWALLAAVAGLYLLVWRRRAALREDPALLPAAALAALLAAICTSKVLSPQFLIWTFPVVALAGAARSRLTQAAAGACLLAALLTQIWVPARYWRLVALEPAPLVVLLARNLALVVAAVLAVAALARSGTGSATAPLTSRT